MNIKDLVLIRADELQINDVFTAATRTVSRPRKQEEFELIAMERGYQVADFLAYIKEAEAATGHYAVSVWCVDEEVLIEPVQARRNDFFQVEEIKCNQGIVSGKGVEVPLEGYRSSSTLRFKMHPDELLYKVGPES